MTAIALTIAGSDPSGGAGIQADLKTFAAHGVFGASAITALTVQNTRGVFGVHAVPPGFVREQAEAVLDDLDVRAVKVGMLHDVPTIEAVAAVLRARSDLSVVVDPVMVAASGDALLEPSAVSALREALLPLADVVTPNAHELGILTGAGRIEDVDALESESTAALALGPGAVLAKGGRLAGSGPTSVDVLATREGATRLEAARVPIERAHGTGCTLSSAIAARLALGAALEPAVRDAKAYVTAALLRAAEAPIGSGARPLHHEPIGIA